MGVRNFVKNTVKKNTNIRSWMDWSAISQNAKVVSGLASNVAAGANKKPRNETFDAAVQRLQLTEADINNRMTALYRVALFAAVLGLGGFGWTIFLLLKGMFLSSLVALSLGALMFIYAFREHFHYFQMKKRRLDCTVKEWFLYLISPRG